MAASKGSKKGKPGASRGNATKSRKSAQPSQDKGKKEGTRMSILGDLRGASTKKGAGSGSGKKLRDGSR